MKRIFELEENKPYLDNSVTTSIGEDVLDAMLPYLQENYGDPNELCYLGVKVKEEIEAYREALGDLVGMSSNHVYFTSSGTEANNWAIRCIGQGVPVCSSVEHLSVLKSVEHQQGIIVSVNQDGLLNLEELQSVLSENISVVSVQYANQDTGIKQNISEVSKICQGLGIPFHVDASIGFGVEHIDMDVLGIDFLTVSSHKVWGPLGSGALISNGRYSISPLLFGCGQECGMRAGALNTAAIAGFVTAAKNIRGKRNDWKKIGELVKQFESDLNLAVGGTVIGSSVPRLPNMSMISFYGSDAAFIAAELEKRYNMVVGLGSAAENGTHSRVLEKMGYGIAIQEGALRFRFNPWVDQQIMDMLVVGLSSALREEALRAII